MKLAFDYNFIYEVIKKVKVIEYSYSGIEGMDFYEDFCVLRFDNEHNRDCFYDEFNVSEFNVEKDGFNNTFIIFKEERMNNGKSENERK